MRESLLSVSHSLLKYELLANAGSVLFMMTFSFGFTPLQYVSRATGPERPLKKYRGLYPTEVLSFENRAKGLSLQSWVTSLCSLINTFGLPPALGAIGYISE
jgi:hypothetical protein